MSKIITLISIIGIYGNTLESYNKVNLIFFICLLIASLLINKNIFKINLVNK